MKYDRVTSDLSMVLKNTRLAQPPRRFRAAATPFFVYLVDHQRRRTFAEFALDQIRELARHGAHARPCPEEVRREIAANSALLGDP